MKKLLLYTALLITITLSGSAIYYAIVLYKAQQYTQEIILPNLANNQWSTPNGSTITLDIFSHQLSEQQRDILLHVQDPGFYQHQGIDLTTLGAGLTTITQAIVKKLYFNPFKPGIAKIKQSLIAHYIVDPMISKNDQLTLFLNVAYFGKVKGIPIIGFTHAAHTYFHRPLQTLDEAQYIALVAMLIAPKQFHIFNHPQANQNRSRNIKALLAGTYTPQGLMDQYYEGAQP